MSPKQAHCPAFVYALLPIGTSITGCNRQVASGVGGGTGLGPARGGPPPPIRVPAALLPVAALRPTPGVRGKAQRLPDLGAALHGAPARRLPLAWTAAPAPWHGADLHPPLRAPVAAVVMPGVVRTAAAQRLRMRPVTGPFGGCGTARTVATRQGTRARHGDEAMRLFRARCSSHTILVLPILPIFILFFPAPSALLSPSLDTDRRSSLFSCTICSPLTFAGHSSTEVWSNLLKSTHHLYLNLPF
ncbi:hypothetical protein BS78_04G238200 [Paspalum vaginatum]|nr:hypothetical protein BS78_04G238200 [Paspalum vaginatum]